MEFLNSIGSQSQTQVLDSQFSGILHPGETQTQEDFSLPGLISQGDQKIQGINLEVIREEDSPMKFPNGTQNGSLNQNQSLPTNPKEMKMLQLSQQIDNIEITTTNPKTIENNVFFNQGNLSNMSKDFKKKIEEMMEKTEKMMDDYKAEFCRFVDDHKRKFKDNAEFLKNLLIAETEYILGEEEKNKVIDSRMEAVFNEMINILNEYNKK